MNVLYVLRHKNTDCAVIAISRDGGEIVSARLTDEQHAPFFGKFDLANAKQWWNMRAVPGSRKQMEEIIRAAGCTTAGEYLAKNLALSLTDTYWLCPEGMNVKWKDVSLYTRDNDSSYDPNASLGGQMDKVWDISKNPPVLIKNAYKMWGQQSINELFATMLHERQDAGISYTRYEIEPIYGGGMKSKCPSFSSEKTEFIPAYEVVVSQKTSNQLSPYDAYIAKCTSLGLDEGQVRDFMDYQTLTDFIISNTDEHLMNFGLLRNTDTMDVIGPAPIFDSGNSMFYNDERNTPYSRSELLERSITSFFDKEEKMLARVQNRGIVKEDLLPTPSETKNFYMEHGIPEERADFIAESYKKKLELFHDFSIGKTITLYRERKLEQAGKRNPKARPELQDVITGAKIQADSEKKTDAGSAEPGERNGSIR